MTRSEFVRHARKTLGLSQEKFAEALYVARESVTRWENGRPVTERSVAQIRGLLAQKQLAHGETK
jgi:transcriptional regulator with XRE-family HTH domain